MFTDTLKKADFYRARIVEALARRDTVPAEGDIAKIMEQIDLQLALLQHTQIKNGSRFDAEMFNAELLCLYQDLTVLYELAFFNAVERLNGLGEYAELYLSNLETKAEAYAQKAALEYAKSSMGNTILFKNTGFASVYENGIAKIDLGEFDTVAGAKLCILTAGKNLDISQTVFELQETETAKIYRVAPYGMDQNVFQVPGESKETAYEYKLDADVNLSASFKIALDTLTPKPDNEYILLGGKGRLSIETREERTFALYDTQYLFTARQQISFYVEGGSFIAFNFSREPEYKSFSGNRIVKPKRFQKVVIKGDAGLAFDFQTDGKLFAACINGTVSGTELYCNTVYACSDYLILERSNALPKRFHLRAMLYNQPDVSMQYVAVKEKR